MIMQNAQGQPLVARFDELGADDLAAAGGKGANLGELTQAGFEVPPGFVLTTAAYRDFVEHHGLGEAIERAVGAAEVGRADGFAPAAAEIADLFGRAPMPDDIAAELITAWTDLGVEAVAVRSSATAEDLTDASFAGQQETYLNVRGSDDLLAAVQACWASLWTAQAMAYRARQQIPVEDVALAVVVQQMIESSSAGVMFTANPTNGHRDQVVIASAWGLGESVVSGAVNTDESVVDKAGPRMVSTTVADKAVMTVYADQRTVQRPVAAELRRAVVLDEPATLELAALGVRIEDHYGRPQDIEWARADGRFFVVQSRSITALPDPEGPVPTEWPVDDPTAMYFRASIVEQLPDPLSPLFAELIDPAVAHSLQTLMSEFVGDHVVRPGDVSLPTINGYAYYKYERAGMIRLLLRTPKAMQILTRTGDRGAVGRWRTYARPRYQRLVADWSARDLATLDDHDLLAGVAELLQGGAEYYTSVQTIIPIAATSETVLTQFYRLVRRPGDPAAATLLLGFDSEPIRAEKSLWDLAGWVRDHPAVADWLLAQSTADVLAALEVGSTDHDHAEFARRFHDHLDRYGHAVYNLDFCQSVPADDPGPQLDSLRFYLRGQGKDPYRRQAATAQRREELSEQLRRRLDPARRRVFDRLLAWAQRSAPVREDALADVGLAWPQMRRMLTELGRRLTDRGVLARPDDVFWLRRAELLDPRPAEQTAGLIEARKEIWRGRRRATPPQSLPRSPLLDRLEAVMPARSQVAGGDTLTGIGASAGRVSAPARVLAGPQEFATMQPGEVLVASITTPAWTSLFAMASAVVTDIGGPLSHSSIVAREYGIPAVLGTSEATRRISNGQQITVDGDSGTVWLREADAEDVSERPADGPPPRRSADGPPPRRRRASGLVGLAVLIGAAVITHRVVRRVRQRR